MDSQQNQQPMPPSYDDEIDLRELFLKIWTNKLWVIVSGVVCVAFAVLYLLVAKPVYQVESFVRPPLDSAFNEINLSGLNGIDAEQAFELFRKTLESKEIRREFFDLPKIQAGFTDDTQLSDDQLFLEFVKEMALKVPVAKKDQVIVSDANTFTYKHTDPQYAANVVNGLVLAANRKAVKEYESEFETKRITKLEQLGERIDLLQQLAKSKREQRIEELGEISQLAISNAQDKLNMLKNKARQEREDRIQELDEAIKIAGSLNIEEPTTLSQLASSGQVTASQMAINAELKNGTEPLYLRGTRHLQAEKKALVNRKSDDFTDPAIREQIGQLELLRQNREIEVLKARQNDLAFIMDKIEPLMDEKQNLESLDIDFASMDFVRVDQPAVLPKKPIKPRKALILAVAMVLGGMIGLFIALIVPVKAED